jgi:hypothetical protein
MKVSRGPVRFGPGWLREVWTPIVGSGLAKHLVRAFLPLYTLVVVLIVGGIFGVLAASAPGTAVAVVNGVLNAATLVLAIAWLIALAGARTQILRRIHQIGFEVKSRPPVLSTRRFVTWYRSEGLSDEEIEGLR